jgi:hypothetical protein
MTYRGVSKKPSETPDSKLSSDAILMKIGSYYPINTSMNTVNFTGDGVPAKSDF